MSMKPTVSRRSGAHVENSPPPEKLNFNPQLLARILFFLKTTKPKAVPLSSKRGTPPFKICSVSKLIAPCEASGDWRLMTGVYISHFAFRISHSICHLPFAIYKTGHFISAIVTPFSPSPNVPNRNVLILGSDFKY